MSLVGISGNSRMNLNHPHRGPPLAPGEAFIACQTLFCLRIKAFRAEFSSGYGYLFNLCLRRKAPISSRVAPAWRTLARPVTCVPCRFALFYNMLKKRSLCAQRYVSEWAIDCHLRRMIGVMCNVPLFVLIRLWIKVPPNPVARALL